MELFHTPPDSKNRVHQVCLRAPAIVGSSGGWVTHRRPRGATMLSIVCIGGGGSGAGGASGATNTGGGGGGSSAVTRGLFLWDFLPDILYCLVGKGGDGPAGNAAGNAGQLSVVAFSSVNTSENQLLVSGAAAAGGGAVAGTGGAAGTVAAATNLKNAAGGAAITWQSIAGTIGTAGGSAAAGTNSTPWSGSLSLCGPGCGGGGSGSGSTDFAGGAVSTLAWIPLLPGGTAGGGRGNNGYAPRIHSFGINKWGLGPFIYGGTGGGSADLSTGGNGGDGFNGSGGGGGGGGTTGGRGGRGGDGLILLTSW